MTDTQSRLRVHGCDFLMERTSRGWEINVRKTLDGPRTRIETKRSQRDAESFALSWAHREDVFEKKGLPSQLDKPRKPRVVIEE